MTLGKPRGELLPQKALGHCVVGLRVLGSQGAERGGHGMGDGVLEEKEGDAGELGGCQENWPPSMCLLQPVPVFPEPSFLLLFTDP